MAAQGGLSLALLSLPLPLLSAPSFSQRVPSLLSPTVGLPCWPPCLCTCSVPKTGLGVRLLAVLPSLQQARKS